MLQAQVNYWTLKENQRHNLVMEDIGYKTLGETVRHNKKTESQKDQEIQLGFYDLSERSRHNLATEKISQGQLAVAEGELAERQRHQRATEKLEAGQLALGWSQLDVAWFNANESQRHNQAYESELFRHQKAVETENQRHDLAYETEVNRHNISIENIDNFRSVTGQAGVAVRQSELEFSRAQSNLQYPLQQEQIAQGWTTANSRETEAISKVVSDATKTGALLGGFTSMVH